MGSPFDGHEETKSKINVAKEALLTLISRLKPTDRFGLVLFDTQAEVAQKLEVVQKINMGSLKVSIMDLKERGGTSLSAGIVSGTKQFDDILNKKDNAKYENRLIFLTDMMPNTGDTDGKSLFDMTAKNAKKKLYTTFIGVGVDFNTELTSLIGSIRACNYFSVQSSKQFKKQMDEEFDYMVTPNVFNCAIDLEAKGWDVSRVFGSPGYEHPEKGRLLFMDSSFPSLKEGSNMTKGGVILVKLKKTGTTSPLLKFNTTYEDREGKKYTQSEECELKYGEEEFYQNISIRKAILLVRYINFFKHFLRDMAPSKKSVEPSISKKTGITVPSLLSKAAKKSYSTTSMSPLETGWKELFKEFIAHFEQEMKLIEDQSLDKALKQLITIYQLEKPKENEETE